jgi:hypothetical protein
VRPPKQAAALGMGGGRTRAFPAAEHTYPRADDDAEVTKKTKMTGS